MGPAPERDHATAAAETVALVLDANSPLPEGPADVEDLTRRLRGHIHQLGVLVPPGEPTLNHAQQLSSAGTPTGYMPSRVHLVMLAEVTQELVATVRDTAAPRTVPTAGWPRDGVWWRRWRPSRNAVRGVVFVLAMAVVITAASLPRQ
ncbi:DUF6415 family natural product biosynthesis protein [Streptomyces violascens]|uniref:DUF6415 family natural product biosynthesis protein n=1 Tax=Streptomyces violascens TaxID=67381 RepID=UPI00167BFFF1|nr:DUF6415 family natural product biosynthesis protein [Streptomyces violascens]GGU38323.1 hypothetical protein GCM10010289_69160 [Streptomyces violascens]